MAGLEGTVKTPFGTIQKKTALLAGGGIAAIAVIVWYRQKNSTAADTTTTATDGEIDPATGFAYGSAEDSAALAAQAAYITPTVTTEGGTSTTSVSNLGFSTNGQWVQAVIAYMISNDLVSDPTQLSSALGKYITGAYVTDTDVALIQQAIAVEGQAPIAGSNGYPPSVNRTPPTTTTTTTTTSAPTGIKVVRADEGGVSLDWTPTPGAHAYKTFVGGKQVGNTVAYSNAYVTIPNAKKNTKYTVGIAGVFAGEKQGPTANITVTTKK